MFLVLKLKLLIISIKHKTITVQAVTIDKIKKNIVDKFASEIINIT